MSFFLVIVVLNPVQNALQRTVVLDVAKQTHALQKLTAFLRHLIEKSDRTQHS